MHTCDDMRRVTIDTSGLLVSDLISEPPLRLGLTFGRLFHTIKVSETQDGRALKLT